ncbi:MAG: hypothetical protein IIV72_00950 [Alistipes sp.]|nr:hypothetical protein [Alistipes sp.]
MRASVTDAAEREQRVFTHFAEPRGGKTLREINDKKALSYKFFLGGKIFRYK